MPSAATGEREHEPAMVSAASMRWPRSHRAAIGSRRARRPSSARSPLHWRRRPGRAPPRSHRGIAEGRARIGRTTRPRPRRAHAAGALRTRRWRHAPRASAAGARSQGPRVSPSSTRTRPRPVVSSCPRTARPRRVAVLIASKRQALVPVAAPARRRIEVAPAAQQPVDAADLAVAQVVARVEADVERDAGDVAGVIQPVRPASRHEGGAAGPERGACSSGWSAYCGKNSPRSRLSKLQLRRRMHGPHVPDGGAGDARHELRVGIAVQRDERVR